MDAVRLVGVQHRLIGSVRRRLDELALRRVGSQLRARRDDEHAAILFAAVLGHDDNCIDIGAHSGTVLDEMRRVAPDGRHIAFEPIPRLAAELRRKFPGAEIQEIALADTTGTSTFTYVPEFPAWSGLRERSYPDARAETQAISVRTARLDDVLDPAYRPTLMKVDVEGAEILVFREAAKTLTRHRPFLLFEHGSGAADRYGEPNDVFDLLTEHGYRLFDIDGAGPYTRYKWSEAYVRADMWYFLARP